jgi:hypothetical protein
MRSCGKSMTRVYGGACTGAIRCGMAARSVERSPNTFVTTSLCRSRSRKTASGHSISPKNRKKPSSGISGVGGRRLNPAGLLWHGYSTESLCGCPQREGAPAETTLPSDIPWLPEVCSTLLRRKSLCGDRLCTFRADRKLGTRYGVTGVVAKSFQVVRVSFPRSRLALKSGSCIATLRNFS